VIPATSTSTNTVVNAPQVQVSTSGTVSVETPVIADPVVNEIVTRQSTQTSVTSTTSRTQESVATSNTAASTEEKKESTGSNKPAASTSNSNRRQIARDTVSKNEAGVASASAPVLVDRPMQVQQLQIVDMLYLKLVKKPIQDNNKSYYNLIMNSQHKHEEMVDGQYK
jgi:hypothetical protein